MIIEFDATYKTNLADAIVTNILHQNVICLVQITLNNAITQILRSLLHVKVKFGRHFFSTSSIY